MTDSPTIAVRKTDPPPCSRQAMIRARTAPLHASVEAAMEAAGCFVTARGYRRYLAAAAPLYEVLEARAEAAGAAALLPDWPERRKHHLILGELSQCGSVAQAAGPDLFDRQWTAGDVLGALYVTEGATLGGAILVRRVRALGLPALTGVCLLDPYGARRGAMWRNFVGRMNTLPLPEAEEAAVLRGATAVFAAFLALGRALAAEQAA